MKRLLRRLFYTFAAFSLLLCVATTVMWVRSYNHSDAFTYQYVTPRLSSRLASTPVPKPLQSLGWVGFYDSRSVSFGSERGTFYLLREKEIRGRADPRFSYQDVNQRQTGVLRGLSKSLTLMVTIFGGWQKINSGFGCGAYSVSFHGGGPGDDIHRWIEFPAWSALLISIILPLLALTIIVKKKLKIASGHCPTCGYDLRATPDRCPECGTIPQPK